MKALSIQQPFAELIVSGLKDREHRTWKTNFRGKFLIHASKKPDIEFMNVFGLNKDAFVYGAIIGQAELYDVKQFEYNKMYAFLIKDPIKFKKPIPAKGALNFWEYKK